MYMYVFNMTLQEPQSVMLGTTKVSRGYGPKRRCVEKAMIYIPVLETLERLLHDSAW